MRHAGLLGFVVLALSSSGCEYQRYDGFSCPNPDFGATDAAGNPDPCHRHSPIQKPESCVGECLAIGPAGFRREPLIMWFGEDSTPPACPDHAKSVFWDGFSGLVAPVECPICTCGPSECALPAGMAATSDTLCQGPDYTLFDAPASWDGACVSPDVIDSGAFGSLAIAPPTIMVCQPIAVEPPPTATAFTHGWATRARACDGLVSGRCDQSDLMCSPTAKPPPPGFRQCIWYEDPIDESALPTCPGTYPEQFVFYEGIVEGRECSPCECGQPLGTQCVAAVTAYQDVACGTAPAPLFESVLVGSGQAPGCVTTMPGTTLGAMSAKWIANEKGACVASGGVPSGEARPAGARVFCCQEPPADSPK